jgi:hypothetical protein
VVKLLPPLHWKVMEMVHGPEPVTAGDPEGPQVGPPVALTYPGSVAVAVWGAVQPAGTEMFRMEPLGYWFDPPEEALNVKARLLLDEPAVTVVPLPLIFSVIVPDPLAAAAEALGVTATIAPSNADTRRMILSGARGFLACRPRLINFDKDPPAQRSKN